MEWIRHWRIERAHSRRHRLLNALRTIERHIDRLQEPDVRREQAHWEQQQAKLDDIVRRLEKALGPAA